MIDTAVILSANRIAGETPAKPRPAPIQLGHPTPDARLARALSAGIPTDSGNQELSPHQP